MHTTSGVIVSCYDNASEDLVPALESQSLRPRYKGIAEKADAEMGLYMVYAYRHELSPSKRLYYTHVKVLSSLARGCYSL